MRFKSVFFLFVLLVICLSCEDHNRLATEVLIIPIPQTIELKGGHFEISKKTTLIAEDEFTVASEFLKEYIFKGSGIELGSGSEENSIRFLHDDEISSPEAYKIEISRDSLVVFASNAKGAFYAVQTIRQIMPVALESVAYRETSISIPCIKIEDKPRFDYRGMHLDVGRHLFPVEFIKKYIDALALLKFNTFHWHLTEDQGWRIEIKKYPKLNEISSFRKETLVGHYSDQPHQFDNTVYGGFYTQEEIREIVEYAQNRQITIIPEIEMPGHSQAVIAAYPELGCTGEEVDVATKWGVFEHIYCSKEESFSFIEDVLDEVLDLFPSEYIHIGGDEAPKKNWEECQNCQARIASEGLKDEHELQSYFISRIETYLNGKGRQIIGWDEILEGGLAPNATVMSWRGVQGAVDAAKMGHKVIMTPTSHCYFDYYQSESESEPLAIGGFLPLRKVYEFNPIPEELTEMEANNVWGAQANVWTEYMKDHRQVEYMVFPRILAMSEVVWSDPGLRTYDDFVNRVEHFHERLEKLD
ncbi:MAG: beta-N-acetylhexosaminidase, partial [Flavobacteriaceae bacterium]|nr:beta-N-acetylhexosaminidase [Flavobacteriaceae bacterium]